MLRSSALCGRDTFSSDSELPVLLRPALLSHIPDPWLLTFAPWPHSGALE